MKRREFIKAGAIAGVSAVAASQVGGIKAIASELRSLSSKNTSEGKNSTGTTPNCEQEATVRSWNKASADLKVRFLGTGAAEWKFPGCGARRNSSILLDEFILIDYTESASDQIPAGCHPKTIFYTHSHGDHFQSLAALKLGVETVYVSETILSFAQAQFAEASQKTGIPAPKIHPMKIGESVTLCTDGRESKDSSCGYEIRITALPANHMTSVEGEQTQIYLIEKGPRGELQNSESNEQNGGVSEQDGGVRVLYATDTAGITGWASRIVGIDPHKKGKSITGLIMEATMANEEDFRIFQHSSTPTVLHTARMLLEKGRLTPPEGQPVYLTHIANSLHPSQEEMDRTLPSPLRAAYDGLEAIFTVTKQ